MAFATANVRTTVFGNLKVTYGDFTASVGDAAGTIGVSGGRVYLAEFNEQLSSGAVQRSVPVSVSTSGNVTTVTVYHQSEVTAGRFLIIHA